MFNALSVGLRIWIIHGENTADYASVYGVIAAHLSQLLGEAERETQTTRRDD